MPRKTSQCTYSRELIVLVFIIGVVVGYIVTYEALVNRIIETTKITQIPLGNLEFLPDRDYYSKLLELLNNTNRSVYIIMYVVKYDPKETQDPVNVILRKLVELHLRGVNVKIIIDDETLNNYPETIEYLLANNIPVKLDESKNKLTHTKMVVIDEEIVLIGIHNWTESALSYNHETSLLVQSRDLAKQVINYFNSIWNSGRSM
ncbi:MAG: phospholipase D-like domain-containing protein [Desulfurococcaceae archaeon]